MTYQLLRIDFSDDPNCNWCTNKLRSGKVRVLQDANGREVQAGPTCARKNASNPNERVPDLTKATLELEGDEPPVGPSSVTPPRGAGAKGTGRLSVERQEQIRRDRAESYLLLRVEKLVGYKDVLLPRLEVLYQRYLNKALTDDDYNYLDNLMAKTKADRLKLSLRNLQATYACHYWIERFLEQDPKPFIQSLQAQLKDRLYLTPAQVGKLNECLSEQKRPLEIDPEAFVR